MQFSFRKFRGFRFAVHCCMCLFALQCRYYLRSGAGNIASDQTYLFGRNNVISIFITHLSRDPRTEPNRAESPQLGRAGPRVPNRTKTKRDPRSSELSLGTSRAQLIGLSFESSLSPESTPSLKLNPSQVESSTEVSSASSQAGSQTKLSRSLALSQA